MNNLSLAPTRLPQPMAARCARISVTADDAFQHNFVASKFFLKSKNKNCFQKSFLLPVVCISAKQLESSHSGDSSQSLEKPTLLDRPSLNARPKRNMGIIDPNFYQQDSLFGSNSVVFSGQKASKEAKERNRLIAQASTVEEILSMYMEYGDEYNCVNLCTSFHRLAKTLLSSPTLDRDSCLEDPRVMQLAEDVQRALPHCEPQALGNIAWAHGKLGHGGPELMRDLCRAAVAQAGLFRSQEIASLLWAVAETSNKERWRHEVMEVFAEVLVDKLESGRFDCRNFHAVVWAYGTMQHPHEGLFRRLPAEVALHAEALPCKTLATIAWAYGKLGISAPRMFSCISYQAQMRSDSLSPIDISHLCWSFAKLDIQDVELLACIAKQTINNLSDFGPQNLANTAWSFARLSYYHAGLFEAMVPHAIQSLSAFSPQSLSNLCWAYAACRHDSPELFKAVARQAAGSLESFSEVGMAALAMSFANMSCPADDDMDADVDEFFGKIEEYVDSRLGQMSSRAVVNTAWALVVVRRFNPELFAKMRSETAKSSKPFSSMMLAQMFQVDLALRYEAPEVQAPVMKTPEEGGSTSYLEALWLAGNLRSMAAQCWHRSKFNNERYISELQEDVATTLESMGLKCIREYDAEEFTIDMAVMMRDDVPMAIEVDGPTHFTRNTLRPVGATLFKHRMLRSLGWEVVSVPFYEYSRHATYQQKTSLLKSLLEKPMERRLSTPVKLYLHKVANASSFDEGDEVEKTSPTTESSIRHQELSGDDPDAVVVPERDDNTSEARLSFTRPKEEIQASSDAKSKSRDEGRVGLSDLKAVVGSRKVAGMSKTSKLMGLAMNHSIRKRNQSTDGDSK